MNAISLRVLLSCRSMFDDAIWRISRNASMPGCNPPFGYCRIAKQFFVDTDVVHFLFASKSRHLGERSSNVMIRRIFSTLTPSDMSFYA
jgi:hypothetical protein